MSDPPKPKARAERVSPWRYLRLFRRDILSAQPAKLYRAWMAEFRTPFFRSYLINDPKVIRTVLQDRPQDFPKSDRVGAGLRPLLGNSVFLTNGAEWERQRRIIDPAFAGGRLHETFPAMQAAAQAAVARLGARATDDAVEFEAVASHAAADMIFRTLFSVPIEEKTAQQVFTAFQAYQKGQPLLNLAAFLPKLPGLHRRGTRQNARKIRDLIKAMTDDRLRAIAAGTAPDDLATKILTTADPETGETLSADEMVDQVAIFFLAGHETSASAFAWALYLLARYPDWQDKVAEEAARYGGSFAGLSELQVTRDVFRETLRLYPPVPMMVREAACPAEFRDRPIKAGSQVVLSSWHLHRHTRLWATPDAFDPARWRKDDQRDSIRQAYMPFSSGPRVCTGAGFAMIEGVLLLATFLKRYHVTVAPGKTPVPAAHLTVRSQNGIWLRFAERGKQSF